MKPNYPKKIGGASYVVLSMFRNVNRSGEVFSKVLRLSYAGASGSHAGFSVSAALAQALPTRSFLFFFYLPTKSLQRCPSRID